MSALTAPDRLRGQSLQEVFALAVSDERAPVAVPLSIVARAAGVGFSANFDPCAREACGHALDALRAAGHAPGGGCYFYAPSHVRAVRGPSLGLGAALALLRHAGALPAGARLWASGEVTPYGAVLPVGGLAVKLDLDEARRGRVVLPRGSGAPAALDALEVADLAEALSCLNS